MLNLIRKASQSADSKETCPICYDSLENAQLFIHPDDGELHPIHKRCMREWVKRCAICPVCRSNVNTNSLLSLKERILFKVKSTPENLISMTIRILKPLNVLGAGAFAGAEVVTAGVTLLKIAGGPVVYASVGAGALIGGLITAGTTLVAIAGGPAIRKPLVITGANIYLGEATRLERAAVTAGAVFGGTLIILITKFEKGGAVAAGLIGGAAGVVAGGELAREERKVARVAAGILVGALVGALVGGMLGGILV